jgi:hypothetical protein
VLGIDETRRGAPKWVQDAETSRWVRTERFETNFTDLAGTGGLLGQFTRMWDEILAEEATGELLAAWIAKEELRYLLALARTGPARSEISSRLFAFYDWCARAGSASPPGRPR